MNHYERLKVTQDAPPEVIRAAYRALANRLQPDAAAVAQGGAAGAADPGAPAHDQLASLNEAYEVLIDPRLRSDYDATLVTSRPWQAEAAGLAATPIEAPNVQSAFPPELAAQLVSPRPAWAPEARHMALGAVVLLSALLIGGTLYWRSTAVEHPLDQVLNGGAVPQVASVDSLQVEAARRGELPVEAGVPAGAGAARRPTVAELARMSDEELVNALPALDGKPAATVRADRRNGVRPDARPHPLDGTPLSLKTDPSLLGSPQVVRR